MAVYPNKESMKVIFESRSTNEGLARTIAGAFLARLDPTIEEVADVKTAVSEAVTNAVIHGYAGRFGLIEMEMSAQGRRITISVRDEGVGIADIERAREPFFTTMAGERSGMGFCFMESFMDELEVISEPGKGTCIVMSKCIGAPVYE